MFYYHTINLVHLTDLDSYLLALLFLQYPKETMFLKQSQYNVKSLYGEKILILLQNNIIRRKRTHNKAGYRYEVLNNKILHTGGMSKVYSVSQTLIEKKSLSVVCKKNKKRVVKELEVNYKNSFDDCIKEENLAKRVKSLHVKDLVVYREQDQIKKCYIVMKKLEGVRLSQIIKRDKSGQRRLSLAERLLLTENLMLALYQLHRLRIIHRDINPTNMIVDEKNFAVQICDLGISKESGEKDQDCAGTLAYMSYEALMGQITTEKSDVCSLGFVLTELWHAKKRRVSWQNVHYSMLDFSYLDKLFNGITGINLAQQTWITQILVKMTILDQKNRLALIKAIHQWMEIKQQILGNQPLKIISKLNSPSSSSFFKTAPVTPELTKPKKQPVRRIC